MIPSPTNYPSSLDTDDNLFLVHDSLRVRLLNDYNPGDKVIYIEDESAEKEMMSRFPPTGIITLTEQCSEIDKRAISFYYSSRTENTFEGLELLPEFEDFIKPKKITNVTMNVMDKHHNHLKDALIAIETFLGIKDQTDLIPFGPTITGRINFIKKLALKPRAWFSVDRRMGIIPFCVTFKEESLRVDENTIFIWDFGDHTTSTISVCPPSGDCFLSTTTPDYGVVSVTDSATEMTNVRFRDLDGGEITKCYETPGIYDVTLTVINENGEDVVVFDELITAKIQAPEKAIININNKSNQILYEGVISNDGYDTPPKIRSSISDFIDLEVQQTTFSSNRSFAGELLDENQKPIDPIVEYTWDLGDELDHSNSNYTRALYSVGGYYNITLRVDTKFGSYRITEYENAIDIIEKQNLWLYSFKNKNTNSSGIIRAWEFGLVSETFKKLGNQEIYITRNNSFLDYLGSNVFESDAKFRAQKEFDRNVGFAQKNLDSSGDGGESLLFWAKGGANTDEKQILIKKYKAFDDTYESLDPISKSWNWASLVSSEKIYFVFGSYDNQASGENLADNSRVDYSLSNLAILNTVFLQASDFENGAEELLSHPSNFVQDTEIVNFTKPSNGYFCTYRSTWKDSSGYLLRNSSVNDFFRIADFYRTNGNLEDAYNILTRLPDMIGGAKTEGQLITLSNGVFFFNNSGDISAWNDTTLTWEVGRSSSSTLSFISLQDRNATNFSDESNSLLAASDNDKIAYLSFDYSEKAFIKFNGTDLTFSSAGIRPSEQQFKLGIY